MDIGDWSIRNWRPLAGLTTALFVALGAAPEKAKPERVFDAIESGVLAMDAYVFN